MSTQQQDSNPEVVGLGVYAASPIKASNERVWEAMVDKIYHTDNYLPVTNVKITVQVPGKHVYREMAYHGQSLNQNIYFDESTYTIRCFTVDKDEVHVNTYHPDTGLLEYWLENKKGERYSWEVPKAIVLAAMEKTKEVAEASQ